MIPGAARLRALFAGPIARGATLSLAIRLIGIAVSFLQAVVAARLLGTENYGIAAVAIAAATMLGTLSTLGLGTLAVREIARQRARGNWGALRGFIGASLGAVAVAGLTGAALLVLSVLSLSLFAPVYRTAVALGAVLVVVVAAIKLQRGMAQGFGRILSSQAPDEVVRPVLLLVFLAIVASSGAPLSPERYLLLLAVAGGLALALGLVALWRAICAMVPPALPQHEVRRWTGEALPFLQIAAVTAAFSEANTLLLGWLADPREAALFQPLARLSPLMTIAMQAVAMPFAPRVSALLATGETARVIAISRQVTLTTTAATLALVAAILAAAPTILAAFGPEFVAAAPALWWIAGAQCFNAACGPVGLLLTMANRAGMALRAQVLALLAMLLLGLALIPGLGAEGAAIALAAGIVTWNIAMLRWVRRDLGIDPALPGALIGWTRPR
ncbi:MAG: oligosaccharide flippase family protein [Pseudomonadota bacterium]